MNTKYYWILLLIFATGCRGDLVEDTAYNMISKYSFQETADRLRSVLKEENIKIFSEIDHAEAAKGADLSLRPTLLFIVGNPNAGTLLMQEDQRVAIALPLKILVYEDERGSVRVAYNLASPLGKNYSLNAGTSVLTKIDNKMKDVIMQISGNNTDKGL